MICTFCNVKIIHGFAITTATDAVSIVHVGHDWWQFDMNADRCYFISKISDLPATHSTLPSFVNN